MKKIIASLLYILISFIANNIQAQPIKAQVVATGLTCSMCSKATYNQLISLSFADSVTTDLDNTSFDVYFKPNAAYNLLDIAKKVSDAGFAVGELTLWYKDTVALYTNAQIQLGNLQGIVLNKSEIKKDSIYQLLIVHPLLCTKKNFEPWASYLKPYQQALKAKKMVGVYVVPNTKL